MADFRFDRQRTDVIRDRGILAVGQPVGLQIASGGVLSGAYDSLGKCL